jgi:hypothetical protein
MKITRHHLKRIIKEEKARILAEQTPGQRARGLHMDDARANRVTTLLGRLYDDAVNDIVAEEGLMEEEAEEMAIEGVIEIVREFLGSVGHTGKFGN